MPTAMLRLCATPGCPALVAKGHCATHATGRERQRGSAHQRGYTRRWDQRAKAFRVRYPLCGMRPDGQRPVMSQCFDQGLATAATQTDHVVPHKGDQRLFWDEDGNWQSLCAECGARKSGAGL